MGIPKLHNMPSVQSPSSNSFKQSQLHIDTSPSGKKNANRNKNYSQYVGQLEGGNNSISIFFNHEKGKKQINLIFICNFIRTYSAIIQNRHPPGTRIKNLMITTQYDQTKQIITHCTSFTLLDFTPKQTKNSYGISQADKLTKVHCTT